MCTLIIGVDVIAPGTVILAGNRDEDPARPSRGPGVLRTTPRIVGGADGVAGGTWMAVRERRAAVAMLNRWRDRGPALPRSGLRSRGLLTLDLAATDARVSMVAYSRAEAREMLEGERYAPFNAVFASPSGSWWLAHQGGRGPAETIRIGPGWHVLTHSDLDDPYEERTYQLNRMLRRWRPTFAHEAREGLMQLLASHQGPEVCIHTGRMVTVSSFVVWLTRHEARYHHLDGRPCEHPLTDYTHLLEGAFDEETE